jgi:hypothetical protein
MAHFTLIPFEQVTAPQISIEAEFNHNEESLFASYRIQLGRDFIDHGNGTPRKERCIGLWEKTCFELFIKNEFDQYVEFNFSPVFEWNCFYFNKKGDALTEWKEMQRPETDILLSKDHFLLFAVIKKKYFPKEFFDHKAELHAGITTVIKDKAGSLSYWALSHADSRPNFHHFDSFCNSFQN